MMDILFKMAEIGTTLLESYLGFRINAALLTDKPTVKLKPCLTAALLLSLLICVMNQYRLFMMFTTAAALAGFTVGSMIIFGTDFWGSMISTVLYILLVYTIDFLSASIWGVVLADSQSVTRIISGYSVYRLIYIIFCKAALFVIWYFFFRKMAGKMKLPMKKMIMASVAGIAVIWYLGSMTFASSGAPLLVTWSLLLFLLLTGLYLLTEYGRWKESRAGYELAIQRNEWIAKNYEQNRMFYHDLNNHYLVIQRLLKQKEYEKAEQYMEKIAGESTFVDQDTWTGNEAFDILLNHKLEEAQRESIRVEIRSEQVLLPLNDAEVTILFGNALDNAIEACRKLDPEKRWIRIHMRRVHEMMFFKISNPDPCDLIGIPGEGATSKADHSRHGLGILSMKMIAEKYGGVVETGIDRGEFILSISFFEQLEDKVIYRT